MSGVNFKACIFDLDGVIVDTARYHYLAWRRLAHELGFDFSLEQNERLKGVSRMRSLEILLEVGGKTLSQTEMEVAAARKNAWYVDYISRLQPEEILPGVEKFLNELKEQGIKTAIGSASKNAGLILRRLNLMDRFETIVDGHKVTKAKPDPEIFLTAARELGVKVSESIVFEDAQAGVEAAHNGKMLCIGVGDPDMLEQADIIINGFEQLTWERVKTWLSR
ncbi:MAG: beta-phosphoglucomutase [Bacteroidales bacterium]|nr:beta-phosphoglucomutase [Bacteroidales bacterium]